MTVGVNRSSLNHRGRGKCLHPWSSRMQSRIHTLTQNSTTDTSGRGGVDGIVATKNGRGPLAEVKG